LVQDKINKYGKVLVIYIWLTLTLFAGLRYANGDWFNYVEIFENIINARNQERSDQGFNILLKSIATISHEVVFMFVVIAGLSVYFNLKSFERYTPYVFIAILMYFVHNFVLKEMIQIRVGLASSICIYSLYYLKNKHYYRTIILGIIATSIHLSALIFFLVIISRYMMLTKKQLLYLVIFSLFIGFIYPLGNVVKEQIGIDDRLDEYIAYGNIGYGGKLGIFGNLNTVKSLILFCFFYKSYEKLTCVNSYFYTLFLGYTIGLCWLICFNDFAIIGARMSNILLSTEPILLSMPLIMLRKSRYWMYKLGCIILSIAMFIMNIDPDKITPYKFYLLEFL